MGNCTDCIQFIEQMKPFAVWAGSEEFKRSSEIPRILYCRMS